MYSSYINGKLFNIEDLEVNFWWNCERMLRDTDKWVSTKRSYMYDNWDN